MPKITVTRENVEINKVLIWDKNPRFVLDFDSVEDINYSDDNQLIKDLIKNESSQNDGEDKDGLIFFKQLLDSLLERGFVKDDDSMFIKLSSNGYYFVLEGNRRVSAMKIIRLFIKDNNHPEWKEWFINYFGNEYFESFIEKVKNIDDKHKFDKVEFCIIDGNDVDEIKQKIFKRDQINSLGKKYWFRIVRLMHILKEFNRQIENSASYSDAIQNICKIFDKTKRSIQKDLDSSKWVYFCLKQYGLSDDEMLNYRVSALELSRSKIVDPISYRTLSDLLKISLDSTESSNINFSIKAKEFDYISIKQLSYFLCESLFKKHLYSTRGWNGLYENVLIDFLYPNFQVNSKSYLTMPFKSLKTVITKKDEYRDLINILSEDDKVEWFSSIYKNISSISDNTIEIAKLLISIKTKISNILNGISSEEKRWKASLLEISSIITFLYNEMVSQQFIDNSSIINFPFSKYSLLFRNLYICFLNTLLMNEETFDLIRNIFLSDAIISVKHGNHLTTYSCNQLATLPSEFSYSKFDYTNIKNSLFFTTRNFATYVVKNKIDQNVKKFILSFSNIANTLFEDLFKKICNNKSVPNFKINTLFFIKFSQGDYSEINKMVHCNHYFSETFFPNNITFLELNFETLKEYIVYLLEFLKTLNFFFSFIKENN